MNNGIVLVLRLGLAVLLLGAGLLTVVRPPNFFFFQLQVVSTEVGYWLAAAALLLLLPWGRTGWLGWFSVLMGVVGAVLLLLPLLQARSVAADLDQRLESQFGAAQPRPVLPGPLPAVETVDFATRPEGSLKMDVYRPASGTAAPGVLVIHGGSWARGDRTEFSQLNPYLAERGYVVASIDYRLTPKHPFPAAYEDAMEAVAFLKTNAARFGLDPTRLVLIGRSAGGQLALLTAYRAPDPAIRGVVSFYGPADLRWGYANPSPRSVYDSCGVLDAYLGGSPERFPAAYDAASPIGFAGASSPPTLMIHGSLDLLVSTRHVDFLSARLREAGRPHLALILPWATHGCDYFFNGTSSRISTPAIERFLAAVTR